MSEKRCPWCLGSEIYEAYHDEEWGVPVRDDLALFEMLNLEGAQAGLSWITVLKKRDTYRKAFHNFDPKRIVKYTDQDIARLMADPGIVRNRLKIYAVIENARLYLEMQKQGVSFSEYLWSFVGNKPIQNKLESLRDVQPSTPESDAMSKDLKKRGFKFVGSTICYAFMQAVGMVNDHLVTCPRYKQVAKLS
ncbi:DNA-3-methyladenine glycosylase I [Terrimicrobium sacchariphilum]|uniref:DNA-3-methyladenine glycosylase I n=1 Tax=Terrimicrobium sacchariphilum TaxID=690879 RepID=A0A146G8I9_TERSA|nr:DNA-3-methyladenine glycosylase I [Terrimicrobium sacchariphilum]GAT33781.1 DNA-3-methyladenine glycosylase I [Terrimicrobium sacchariphilum]